jgi:hypothetical protein
MAGQPGFVAEAFAAAVSMPDLPRYRFVGVDGAILSHGATSSDWNMKFISNN